jgi:hypothetical protein
METAVSGIGKAEALADEAGTAIKSLTEKINQVSNKIFVLQDKLEKEAKGNADKIAKVRSLVKIAGAIATVIPVGQPYVGIVGKLTIELADYDEEKNNENCDKLKDAFNSTNDAIQEVRKASKEALIKKQKEKEEYTKNLAENLPKLDSDIPDRPRSKLLIKKPSSVTTDKQKQADGAEEEAKQKAESRSDTNWKAFGSNFGTAVSTGLKAIHGMRAPQSAIDAELAKLRNASDEWQIFAKELAALNVTKTYAFDKLSTAVQAIGEGYSRVSSSSAALYTLSLNHAATVEKLDSDALLVIQQMQQQAELSLLVSIYQMAKAYETTVFEAPTINWSLLQVTNKITDILTQGTDWSSKSLTKITDNLMTAFQAEKGSLRDGLIKYYGFAKAKVISDETQISIDENPQALKELNSRGWTTLDPLSRDLVSPQYERHRISDVTLNLEFDFPGGPESRPKSGNLEVVLHVGAAGIM